MTHGLIIRSPGVPACRCGYTAQAEDVAYDPDAYLADLAEHTAEHHGPPPTLTVRLRTTRWRRRVHRAL